MPDGDPGEPTGQHPAQQSQDAKTVESPAPPNTPYSQPTQPTASQSAQQDVKDIEDRVKRAERWMIGLTFAIAFFALCSVVVGVLQWNAMRGQLGEMKGAGKQTDDLIKQYTNQAKATQGIVEEAKRSADSAQQSVNDNLARMKLEMRPYLIRFGNFQTTGLPPDPSMPNGATPITVFTEFKNIGKSIAKRAVLFYSLERITAVNQAEQTERVFREAEAGTGRGVRSLPFDIAPEETTRTLLPLTTLDPFSAPEISSFRNGQLGVLFTGGMSYEDVFRNPHRTEFCVLFYGNTAAQNCLVHRGVQ